MHVTGSYDSLELPNLATEVSSKDVAFRPGHEGNRESSLPIIGVHRRKIGEISAVRTDDLLQAYVKREIVEYTLIRRLLQSSILYPRKPRP